MSRELEGKVALVTGASRGIGLATALELGRAGARVALLSRDGARARAAAATLSDDLGRGYGCDVISADQVSDTVARVEEDLGPVDVAVNNAGMTRDQLLVRISDEDWNAVLDVNLRGMFHVIRSVSRGMIRRRFGVIINVSSVVGLMGNAGQASYAAAKAGVIGLTKSVARELGGRGIRANAVAPG